MGTTNIKSENKIKGRGVGSGLVIGEAFVLDSEAKIVTPEPIQETDVKLNKSRFLRAKKKLIAELGMMAEELDDIESSEIIDTQKQIIEDVEIEKNVFEIIENKLLSVDYAIFQTYDTFIEKLKESASELFRQRIIDLENIRDRFVAQVSDQRHRRSVTKGSIIIAKEISPTDLVSFYEDGAIGLAMEKGGITSHAAIIAKSLGIPCIVSVDHVTKMVDKTTTVILEADTGSLILNPSKRTLKEYKKKKAGYSGRWKNKKDIAFKTADGQPYNLLANIEFENELPKIRESGAHGIGLLRTESLLFGNRIRKSVEDQQNFYTKIVSGVDGPVTIRLFDIGGDKTSGRTIKESNPFLGWRGIRLLLDKKQLLRDQLRAILVTADKFPGRVKILAPMISMVEEVKEIKSEIELVRRNLKDEGMAMTEEIPLGLMVEVPSVALMAYQFAKEVDFLSVGTNDLTQYTLAVDRGNERICSLFQHYHPSVLRLIKMTLDGVREAGIDISVCGELAGDEIGAAFLLGLGIKELSMGPHSIPKINNILSSRNEKSFQEFAQSAMVKVSADEVEKLFEEWKTDNEDVS